MGALWCFGLMVFFSFSKAMITLALCAAIRLYAKCLGFKKDWGSSFRGMQLEMVPSSVIESIVVNEIS